ncbi:MAG: hypothetical protein H0X39_11450 [Actinobacteria bacterium]|nr:hypothetical protein [Actinomycetota bacterium]
MADDPEPGRLTEQELAVVNHIAAAYTAFSELPVYHSADDDEFVFRVHAMGRIVLTRAASRGHSERAWIKTPRESGRLGLLVEFCAPRQMQQAS